MKLSLKVTDSIQCSNSEMVVIYILASRGSRHTEYKHIHMQGGRHGENPNVSVWPKHCCFFRDYTFNLGMRKWLRANN